MLVKVWIKNFDVAALEIRNKGIELDIYSANGDKHRGDLVVTKAGLIWCTGKTTRKNGKPISWDDFIAYMATR
jgi:hypothetical protein